MPTADLLPALRQYLITNVGSGINDRVFSEELPEDQAASMPRTCVVIKEAGGFGSRGFLTVGVTRIDVRCYGSTPFEARELRRSVHNLLKNMRAQLVTGTDNNLVKVLSAIEASGPMSMRDPDTRWPFTLSMWSVMAREIEIAS